jgi:hypothetical protein
MKSWNRTKFNACSADIGGCAMMTSYPLSTRLFPLKNFPLKICCIIVAKRKRLKILNWPNEIHVMNQWQWITFIWTVIFLDYYHHFSSSGSWKIHFLSRDQFSKMAVSGLNVHQNDMWHRSFQGLFLPAPFGPTILSELRISGRATSDRQRTGFAIRTIKDVG